MSNYLTVEVAEVKAATEKAILVRLEDDEEKWIPLSLIDGKAPVVGECDCEITLPKWFCEKEDIEGE